MDSVLKYMGGFNNDMRRSWGTVLKKFKISDKLTNHVYLKKYINVELNEKNRVQTLIIDY